jgi:hypothetical protein
MLIQAKLLQLQSKPPASMMPNGSFYSAFLSFPNADAAQNKIFVTRCAARTP